MRRPATSLSFIPLSNKAGAGTVTLPTVPAISELAAGSDFPHRSAEDRQACAKQHDVLEQKLAGHNR